MPILDHILQQYSGHEEPILRRGAKPLLAKAAERLSSRPPAATPCSTSEDALGPSVLALLSGSVVRRPVGWFARHPPTVVYRSLDHCETEVLSARQYASEGAVLRSPGPNRSIMLMSPDTHAGRGG